MTIGSDTSFST